MSRAQATEREHNRRLHGDARRFSLLVTQV
jgi:hypothetical protein